MATQEELRAEFEAGTPISEKPAPRPKAQARPPVRSQEELRAEFEASTPDFERSLQSDLGVVSTAGKEMGPYQPPAGAEAAIRGGLQGVTGGWSDELAAGIDAALAPVLAKAGIPLESQQGADAETEDFQTRYQRSRDYYRARNEAARAAHPKTYLGSEIVGGIAPQAKGAQLLKAAGLAARSVPAAAGAAIGAASSLGHQEAPVDLTSAQTVVPALGSAAVGGFAGEISRRLGAALAGERPSITPNEARVLAEKGPVSGGLRKLPEEIGPTVGGPAATSAKAAAAIPEGLTPDQAATYAQLLKDGTAPAVAEKLARTAVPAGGPPAPVPSSIAPRAAEAVKDVGETELRAAHQEFKEALARGELPQQIQDRWTKYAQRWGQEAAERLKNRMIAEVQGNVDPMSPPTAGPASPWFAPGWYSPETPLPAITPENLPAQLARVMAQQKIAPQNAASWLLGGVREIASAPNKLAVGLAKQISQHGPQRAELIRAPALGAGIQAAERAGATPQGWELLKEAAPSVMQEAGKAWDQAHDWIQRSKDEIAPSRPHGQIDNTPAAPEGVSPEDDYVRSQQDPTYRALKERLSMEKKGV